MKTQIWNCNYCSRPLAYANWQAAIFYSCLFFLFIKRAVSKTASALWRQAWQDEGPHWEVVHMFQIYLSRGLSEK